ncbi:MAG: hypothetical protein AB1646_17445 [Thermodesulfobacteriota bacterium]
MKTEPDLCPERTRTVTDLDEFRRALATRRPSLRPFRVMVEVARSEPTDMDIKECLSRHLRSLGHVVSNDGPDWVFSIIAIQHGNLVECSIILRRFFRSTAPGTERLGAPANNRVDFGRSACSPMTGRVGSAHVDEADFAGGRTAADPAAEGDFNNDASQSAKTSKDGSAEAVSVDGPEEIRLRSGGWVYESLKFHGLFGVPRESVDGFLADLARQMERQHMGPVLAKQE